MKIFILSYQECHALVNLLQCVLQMFILNYALNVPVEQDVGTTSRGIRARDSPNLRYH